MQSTTSISSGIPPRDRRILKTKGRIKYQKTQKQQQQW